MANPTALSVNDALGERAEDSKRVVLPESYYPVQLSVTGIGTTDVKQVQAKDANNKPAVDDNNQPIMIEGGGVPFAEVSSTIFDGPFKGITVTQKQYFSPGRKGGGLGLALGATKAITRAGANTLSVCQKFGITLPSQGSMDPKEYSQAVREAIADAFFDFDPAKRLDFVSQLLNLPAWDGKKIVVKLNVESRAYKSAEGEDRTFSENKLAGFFPIDDPKKGVAWVRATEFPAQQEAYDAMSAAGLL